MSALDLLNELVQKVEAISKKPPMGTLASQIKSTIHKTTTVSDDTKKSENKESLDSEMDNGDGYYTEKKIDSKWYKNRDWMKHINGDKKISDLNIPGTHDTMALYGGAFFVCQTLHLEEQLKMGIRYIDIRCRRTGDCFSIHHMQAYQHAKFGDVRDICYSFLQENPSEIILMRVKDEWKPEANSKPFNEIWNSYVNKDDERWYQDSILDLKTESVESLRGKIVKINGLSDINAQDYYDIGTIDQIDKKYKEIKTHALNSIKGGDDLCLNHLSASSEELKTTPFLVAKYSNAYFFKEKFYKQGRVGVIVMDFPCPQLVDEIISSN